MGIWNTQIESLIGLFLWHTADHPLHDCFSVWPRRINKSQTNWRFRCPVPLWNTHPHLFYSRYLLTCSNSSFVLSPLTVHVKGRLESVTVFLSQHRLCAGSFAVLVLQLCDPSKGSVTCLILWLVSTGERKAILLARENIHFLNSGCCPSSEIRWKLKGKYLYPDRTNLSFESHRWLLGKAVEAWTVQNPSKEIPSNKEH